MGAIIGILYLYYEYKASMKMWPVGILMSSFYIYVFIDSKFYAFAIINMYYIIAGIYGWINWHRSKNGKNNVEILRAPKRYYIPLLVAIGLIFCLVAYLLQTYTDSPVPYGDSFVTTLSIVAMWMLAQKWAEQWVLLIILNMFSVGLYFWQDLYPTSAMYFVYSIVSIFGYIRWRRIAHTK